MSNEDLIFESQKVKELFTDIMKKIKLNKQVYNIQLDLIIPEEGYINCGYIKELIAIYNTTIAKKTKLVLVPVYNLPMV